MTRTTDPGGLSAGSADGVRPDIVLNLPGRGSLVIDAKFPLDDYQRAVAASTEPERRSAFAAHAKALAKHVADLVQRDYPSKVKDSINFTVCFVPGEDLLATAYEERPSLFYEAVRDRVLTATPATLMALLWGVAYGWQQDARVQHAQQVGETGAVLYQRLGTLVGHLDKLGGNLNKAVTTYNELLGSLESRVIPQARKFEDLDIVAFAKRLPDSQPINAHARPVSASRYPSVSDLETDYQPTPTVSKVAETALEAD